MSWDSSIGLRKLATVGHEAKMAEPLTVLSFQSDVVRGHVGNGAARFALQRLGVDVWAVPTVLLSNHPGHGRFRGEAMTAPQIAALIDGLGRNLCLQSRKWENCFRTVFLLIYDTE